MIFIFLLLKLTSLCIIDSRFIHLIRTDSNAFLFMAEYNVQNSPSQASASHEP